MSSINCVRELIHLGINASTVNDERSAISNKETKKLQRGLGPVLNLALNLGVGCRILNFHHGCLHRIAYYNKIY
jgi:hypothetical protein